MAPRFSIIIPHKRTPMNNLSLKMNLGMLQDNTESDYELIIDTEVPKDPYKVWNEAAAQARGEMLVFSNSDVLMGRKWDMPMVEACVSNSIVTGYLVEPGNIGVAAVNIHKDFGRDPSTFNRLEFEQWAEQQHPYIHQHKNGESWYMPCMVNRKWFLSVGGFDTTLGFPNPNDILFWNRCEAEFNTKFIRVPSFAYHFQNLSGR